jgi:hypothetical protein
MNTASSCLLCTLAILFLGNCSAVREDPAPFSGNNEALSSSTPLNESNANAKFTGLENPDGWHVPLPSAARRGPVETGSLMTAHGSKVKVITTTFVDFKEYLFTYGTVTKDQEKYLGHSSLKLIAIKELKVGDHVFSYVILATKVNLENVGSNHSADRHHFFYKIWDKDGDGKFETLDPGLSDSLVPSWVALK